MLRHVIVYVVCITILMLAGIYEKRKIANCVEKIPVRVNVNGIRGKSTATRFITAILDEAGYKVIGKTTGTSARMIHWGESKEFAIKRRPVGANIGEQVSVLQKAADMGAEVLVCECMAVNPDYQKVYQHQILHGNILVITNVVEDHLDEMGPTTEQIAWAFGETFPYGGILIITKGPYAEYFSEIAAKRDTKVICMDPEMIDSDYVDSFPYMVFKNNCALGLGFARAMGIDEELAMRAMLKAHPEPGMTQIVKVTENDKNCWLVNAFAANEPTSSLEIWKQIRQKKLPKENAIVMICCRDDRLDRTHQFVEDFLPYVNIPTMMVIGTGSLEVCHAYQDGKFKGIHECIDLTGYKAEGIIDAVKAHMNENIIFCVGNIHGVAEEFLSDFADIHI